ncbi:MAG: CreA family protein [Pseudomonadota bacterium]
MHLFTLRFIAALFCTLALVACGADEGEVGEFYNDWTGNEIKVDAFADPKVDGVTCHMSHFDRGVIDRISKGKWFEDPSNASIACRQTGPISIADIKLGKSGEEVFKKRQSLIFKTVAVRRIYDPDNAALLYLVYSRKPIDGSSKMSLSTVALFGAGPDGSTPRPANLTTPQPGR